MEESDTSPSSTLSGSPTAWVLGNRAETEEDGETTPVSHRSEESPEPSGEEISFHLPSCALFLPPTDSVIPVDSTAFFFQLCSGDKSVRGNALDNIINALEDCAGVPNNPVMIKALPCVRRLAEECPFSSIRKRFADFIVTLKECGYKVPRTASSPSFFVPNLMVTPIDTESVLVKWLFKCSFIRYGRVSHITRVLAWHPKYLKRSMAALNLMLDGSGPLRPDVCHYIGIMAAASYKCRYLVRLQEKEFLLVGGEPSWLRGLHAAPMKIQILARINALLTSQAWQVSEEHVERLVKHDDVKSRWTIAEVVHALVLMSTFRELAGIVFGCGVAPELDLLDPIDINSTESLVTEVELLGEDERHQMSDETDKMYKKLLHDEPSDVVLAPSECQKHFENLASDSYKLEVVTDVKKRVENGRRSPPRDLSRFLYTDDIGPLNVEHVNFQVKSSDHIVLRATDFNWKDHGYSLMSRYFGGVAPLLDETFTFGLTMTDNQLSEHKNVNTRQFRRAIWYYVHGIHGIMHDDYDYKYVNIYLNISTKGFAKKVSCSPSTIVRSDFANMGLALRPEEKVHVILLASLARKQAELLHGLNAVMKFMG